MERLARIKEQNDQAKAETMKRYDNRRSTPLGRGKVCFCLPNRTGVKVIQIYDMITCILIVTLYRTYHACQIFNETEDFDVTNYIKARKCTFCLMILLSVGGFIAYTVLLIIQNEGTSMPS